MSEAAGRVRVYTVGHSTRSAGEFTELLREAGIARLVDIRRYPGSRKHPQFGQEALRQALEEAGIAYSWVESLGGRRHGKPAEASGNQGLRSAGFRNYADYMVEGEFREAASQVVAWARERPTAIMCAERLYWKCHRRLVADWLEAQGVEVWHLMEPGKTERHRMTPGAVVRRGEVTYPREEEPRLFE